MFVFTKKIMCNLVFMAVGGRRRSTVRYKKWSYSLTYLFFITYYGHCERRRPSLRIVSVVVP